ncbi:MAG: acyl-CoA dehydrogenase [Pseudonocardia sp. SCN 72-86]|nr:MAG: acyl-CoA dehydrogenase [Pseudonocardia sp. SCN 72-86]
MVARVDRLLVEHDPTTTDRLEFLRARFDSGLAWVHFPAGLGGLGLSRDVQPVVDSRMEAAGAPDNSPRRITIGLGMAAPTILEHGTPEQRERYLRPLWTGEEIWCQLFSEPGAGSDLAGLSTSAVRDGNEWVVNGQKVWTSRAHNARWAILVARTDPALPKHRGLTYFVCDMTDPGVDVRPLRQITGEAEFSEVFLSDVRIPDSARIGEVGGGWAVVRTTLDNERVSIGARAARREDGIIGRLSETWRTRPGGRTHELHHRVLAGWADAEVARVAAERQRQIIAAGQPGVEGSAAKLRFARIAQQLSGIELELLAEDGLLYSHWTMGRPDEPDMNGRDAGFRYLRAKGNSIEGGTSEILRNIVAERILGLPAEARTDTRTPWQELPR